MAQDLIFSGASRPGSHEPRLSSVGLFIALTGIAIVVMQFGSGFFPGDRGGALAGRLVCSLAAVSLLIAGSRRLLQRDHLAADRLGLALTAGHATAVLFGIAIACALILSILGVFYLVAPFELLPGPLSRSAVAVAFLNYFAGNFGEELVFRGYLLIALAQWLGTTRALWLLALPFGLFHLPGLDVFALSKMILTTGAMHFVFAYAYLASRSLWAAVSLHAVSNTLLHTIIGTGKPAMFSLQFRHDLPAGVDMPFLVFFGAASAFALLLSRLPQARRGAAWLEAAGAR